MILPSKIEQHSGPLEMLLQLTELLPANYAQYRPLVADGLSFFLQRLSPLRQQAILAAQLALPTAASRERRVLSLFRLCPTLHKLGQVVAHDRRLSADLRARLQELETLAPTDSLAALRSLLDREVGTVAGLQLGQETIAEGSVAVVVPFVWRQAKGEAPQRGVFKLLRPGVQDRLEEELAIWPLLGTFLEERCAHHGLPVLDYGNTLEMVARLLANEVRLDQEQEHLRQAADLYAGAADILIPRLFPFCTPLVTAMERVDGCKVTHQDLPAGEMCQRAERVTRALLAQPFWGSGEAGAMFHADPHAGNLLATADGRLAIIDWALTTRLTKAQCEAVVQLVLGAVTLNETRVCTAIAALGQPGDETRVQVAVSAAIAQVRCGRFPGFDWMTSLMDSLAAASAVRFPEEIALFRKALLTLSGVVADVSGQTGMDGVLVRHGAAQFLRGLMWRPWAWADSRAVGAHLSTADLVGLWADLPATTLRFLAGDRGGRRGAVRQ
ncbi:MAG: putative ubiquinone biosynthesis protein UbiB [Candidatus Accumulibacter regalis]|jgi:ubiquinone biosynthesis protein|uniref:Ubiquinone biosynthesis protein UbiB n=1 Tax=Accumulibacter regalis TaxID=522306 RepID=A0A011PTQ4_ACCRE|nr:AarF/UbiB family protein [Accumulibacter sp.]EXI90786.1 MAG: putative ubiquinone biosynthesis protein UbiB [Candidatus Accumulibacter regalis]HRE69043.1 AarF/UbiB family protein [Accumulibacter sp.]HRI90208.1 AarF/UbiB family protein [Accumulibacter sp.]